MTKITALSILIAGCIALLTLYLLTQLSVMGYIPYLLYEIFFRNVQDGKDVSIISESSFTLLFNISTSVLVFALAYRITKRVME